MSKKDEVQQSIISQIVDSGFRGIVLASVRVGKTRILLNSIKEDSGEGDPKVLVLYPNIDIKKSWEKECDIIDYHPNISYCTYISIDRVRFEDWDYVVCDEAHLIPEEVVLPKLGEFVKQQKNVILASGTYNSRTMKALMRATGLSLIVGYTTEEAIVDGIVSNFNVVIHKYDLTDKQYWRTGTSKRKWKTTERKELARLTAKIYDLEGQDAFLAAINRMRFINSCPSLIEAVNNWIDSNPLERFILFTGDEKVGKNYDLPMYNSKSPDDTILRMFQEGEINKLCLIKKGQTGVTFPNLQTILVTALNSNSEHLEQIIGRSLLNDTEDSTIHIFISTEKFQDKWLKKALENINPQKITYEKLGNK